MFSWSKKKETKRAGRPSRDSEENEFGIKVDKGPDDKQLEAELKRLAGVDSFPEDDLNVNEAEEDVESELLRLIGGGRGKRPQKQTANSVEPVGDITELTADIDLGDEDVDVDENDPDLLGELLELTNPDEALEDEPEPDSETEEGTSGELDIVATLKERLKLYKTAEAKAKENNESSRARRFSRGIKTLEDLLKKAKAGKTVSPEEIPPVIAINLKPAPPPPPPKSDDQSTGTSGEFENSLQDQSKNTAEVTSPASDSEDVMSLLLERLKLYQAAEAKAKEGGETTRARRFNRGIKTLQGLITQAKAGKPVAPEDIPPEVALNLKPAPPVPVQPPTDESVLDNYEERVENEMGNISFTGTSDDAESNEAPEQERNIMDVLSERLQLYKTAEAKAKENGETSRARRFNRGIKSLQDLIRQATAGKPIAPDDIPPMIAVNLKPAPVVALTEEDSKETPVERADLVRSADVPEKPLSFAAVDDSDVDLDEELNEDEEMPTTVLEGLEQRVRLYSKFEEQAREEGDLSSADENERIARVYLNAIKTFKSGGFVDVEKLPNPKKCPPIPIPFFVP